MSWPRDLFSAIRDDGRALICGILNVTPDSFSDGGQFATIERACAQVARMLEEGADYIDIGAESSRPGALAVPAEQQIARVLPVVREILRRWPALSLSIDTRNASVARSALEAGVCIVNDISAGGDPDMFKVVAGHAAGMILMHMQGTPETMQLAPAYVAVVDEVKSFLLQRVHAARAAGIDERRLAIDPGIGFGKTRTHNLELLAHLARFVATGFPVLLGTSRKRFMGAICAETVPQELGGATCATTALGVAAGVRAFRVHDVKANRQAADVAWAIASARGAGVGTGPGNRS